MSRYGGNLKHLLYKCGVWAREAGVLPAEFITKHQYAKIREEINELIYHLFFFAKGYTNNDELKKIKDDIGDIVISTNTLYTIDWYKTRWNEIKEDDYWYISSTILESKLTSYPPDYNTIQLELMLLLKLIDGDMMHPDYFTYLKAMSQTLKGVIKFCDIKESLIQLTYDSYQQIKHRKYTKIERVYK